VANTFALMEVLDGPIDNLTPAVELEIRCLLCVSATYQLVKSLQIRTSDSTWKKKSDAKTLAASLDQDHNIGIWHQRQRNVMPIGIT
jgi:hypothetical protein